MSANPPGGNSSQPQAPQPPQGQNSYQQPPQGQNSYQQPPQGQNSYQQPPQGQNSYQQPPQNYQNPAAGPVIPQAVSDQCKSTIKTCSIVAAAIAFLPIPVADSVAIIITQIIMVSSLCGKYGRPMGGSIVLIILSAMLGPFIFNLLAEMIPALGWALAAAVSFFFTFYVGSIAHELLMNNKAFTFGNFIEGFRSMRANKNRP
jgi:uncharacterized protein (DUF697 family)